MKKTFVVIFLTLVLTSFVSITNDCDSLIFFKEGTKTTMTSYNDDEK